MNPLHVIGTHLSNYKILRKLGEGAMGTVYLAALIEPSVGLEADQHVAIKIVQPNLLASPNNFKRFMREARIGQGIRHENVVRTMDCDTTIVEGHQHHYLVMEYVEGQTLRSLQQELPRVPEELCRHIAIEVAKGLTAIHATGAVHRDIKPDNVLITKDHVVKIMDLGVAHLQDEVQKLSQTGVFIGSMEYASPEQFSSNQGAFDGRADLYALGVVLYELSTGRHPYRVDELQKLLRCILEQVPRKVGELNPQLSPFFEEVIHTLMAKDRGERFDSATQLVRSLEEGEVSPWWQQRARGMRAQTRRPLRRISVPRETALFGRDLELAKLHAAYDASKQGKGNVVLLEGEAGVGKTRVVDEFVRQLLAQGEDLNFAFGSYPPGHAATATTAFSDALREQFGAEDLVEALATCLGTSPGLMEAFAAVLRGEPPSPGATPLPKESLQTLFVQATRALAAERPTILLIDDLHFAPDEGRALFASLSMAVANHSILLIGTFRPGLSEDWVSGLSRLGHVSHRVLPRLGSKDLFHLLQDSFGSEQLALELAGKIALKCDGNPFFAFEIIRGLRQGQFIVQQHDGTWATTRAIENIEVPSSISDLVHARLRDLDDRGRELLEVASCSGYEFDPGLVADVVGMRRLPALRALARIEQVHRLIRSTGRTYTFDHHQVQETLYAGLHEQLREELHAAIAETMEARAGAARKEIADVHGATCVELCEQWIKGARKDRAVRYLRKALRHLSESYLRDRVVVLAETMLAEPQLIVERERSKVLFQLADALQESDAHERERSAMLEIVDIAVHLQDEVLRGRALNALGRTCLRMGALDEAQEHFQASSDIFTRADSRLDWARSNRNLGIVFHVRGETEKAAAFFVRSLEAFQASDDREAELRAMLSVGLVWTNLGKLDEARECLERCVRMASDLVIRDVEASAHIGLGNLHNTLGDMGSALSHHEQAQVIFRETRARHSEATVTMNIGNVYRNAGRLKQAVRCGDRALEIYRELGDAMGEAGALVNRGITLCALGQRQEAHGMLSLCLEMARELGSLYVEGYALAALGLVAEQEGDNDRALALMDRSLTMRRAMGHVAGVNESLMWRAGLLMRAQRNDEAKENLQEALKYFRAHDVSGGIAHVLARLAYLEKSSAHEAKSLLSTTRASVHALPAAYWIWRTTGEDEYLEDARQTLDDLVEHAPADVQQSMVEHHPLYQNVIAACKQRGI